MTRDSEESVDIRKTNEKYSFEQKELKVQKVFWVLIIIFLTAGLLGLFGEGVLSNTRVEEDEFYIEYERFLRDDTSADFSIFVRRNPGNRTIVALSKDYVEKVKIEGVVPHPESIETKDHQLIYTFQAAENGLITFNITPQTAGRMKLDITVQGKTRHLNQYVFF